MADVALDATTVLPGTAAVLGDGIAGEAITAGQPIYLNPADSKYYKCDNDVAGGVPARVAAVAATTAPAAGMPIKFNTRDDNYKPGFAVTAGQTVWTSSTAGGMTVTAADNTSGKYVGVLGVGKTGGYMKLNPTYSPDPIP
jgi:hypothetical protein